MLENHSERISLIIPCHNEELGLTKLLPNIPQFIDEVIIIDNNSTDNTVSVAKKYNYTCISELEKGYGKAYQTGFQHATGDIIVTMDGDGQYPIDSIKSLVNIACSRNSSFIVGNRFPLQQGDAMPLLRKIGNMGLTFFANLLFSLSLQDSQSGMWVFHRSLAQNITPKNKSMAFSQEIKIRAILAGAYYEEAHITYENRMGTSKLSALTDGLGNLAALFYLKKDLRTYPQSSTSNEL